MYTPKVTVHYNVPIVNGRYITIKDPYRDPHLADPVPGRWRKKQFEINRFPENAGGGYFAKLAMPAAGKDPYVESVPYHKTYPVDKRKVRPSAVPLITLPHDALSCQSPHSKGSVPKTPRNETNFRRRFAQNSTEKP